MIKIENGNVEITGALPDVMANLSTLVHHMYHNILTDSVGMSPEKAKETILSAVEDGFMSKDEIHAKALDALEKIKNNPEFLLDMLQAIFDKKG